MFTIWLTFRARQQEFDSMSKGDIFQSFYKTLDEIQQYHKRFPGMLEKPVLLMVLFNSR